MANRPSPNWQVCHTTYIPLFSSLPNLGGEKCYRSHLLGEPETTIEVTAGGGFKLRFGCFSYEKTFPGFLEKSEKSL